MQYRQVRTISGKGGAPAEFRGELRGIALDRQGRLYAAGDSEIKVFGAGGALERRWSTALPPYSVAVSADSAVWAGQTGQIEIFDGAGKLLSTWKDGARMGRVTSIGFLKDSVLVGDAAQRCVYRFDAAGKFLNSIGKDSPLEGLRIPNGVVDFCVDSQDAIHVANPGKYRVERYSAQGALLGHMGKFTGQDPSGFSGCCNPTNVAIAGPNLLCVTEKAGPRAKIYDFTGNLLATIQSADFDVNTRNMDVAVSAHGSVYIADPMKAAIFVFEPVGKARS